MDERTVESIYISLKRFPTPVDIGQVVHLIKFYLIVFPKETLRNLFNFHILIGLLMDLEYPVVRDFYINLVSPSSSYFHFSEEIQNIIWYLLAYFFLSDDQFNKETKLLS